MDIVLEFRQCDDFENVFMYPMFESQDVEMKNYSDHILKTKVQCLQFKVVFKNTLVLVFIIKYTK